MVRHHVNPITLSFVPSKEALISSSICPGVQSEASNLTVHPFTCKLSSICPSVGSKSIDFALNPIAFILRIVLPHVPSISIFLSILVSSFEIFILPEFDTHTTLCVFEPLALVLSSVLVYGDSFAVAHIIDPFSLVRLSYRVCEFAIALCVAKVPISLICCTVVEIHDAFPMSKTLKPLALIPVSCVYVGVFLVNKHFM